MLMTSNVFVVNLLFTVDRAPVLLFLKIKE